MAALMGLATSCSKDDASLPGNPENSNRVSMSVTLPQDMAATRAVPASPAGHKLRCILEVWTEDGNTLKIRKELAQTTTSDFTFDFELSDAGNYKAVLWADYIDALTTESSGHFADKYYTTDATTGLKAVAVKTLTADDAAHRDAFTGVEAFTKGATALSLTPTLTRALTKISIFEKTQDNYNLCKKVTATYKVPSKFNAFTGTADLSSDLMDGSYAAAPEGSNTSMLLFSDYVLANADGTLGGIALKFESNDASKLLAEVTIPAGIPAKRNYRINAKGNLIQPSEAPSPKVNMEVSISEGFTEPDEEHEVNLLEVGDFYMKDGTCIDKDATLTEEQKAACIGVVYWVGDITNDDPLLKKKFPQGTKGLVAALHDAGNNSFWSSGYEDITTNWLNSQGTTYGITSLKEQNKMQGYANTQALIGYNASDRATGNNSDKKVLPIEAITTTYAAAHLAHASSSGWYFPSFMELKYLCWGQGYSSGTAGRDFLNAQLGKVSGTSLQSFGYWPSTEGVDDWACTCTSTTAAWTTAVRAATLMVCVLS